ncbi:hypothetical protein RGQ13_05655 [Thalassotalea psychrophila]|uniref:Anti-sigma factor n=1 Tax=Thalassotalea psychrophila TaxID=3065647 RepID=A0ABY9TXI6_9GAMM|nr:hypothetical protein RGQ13_05655 [Colwelliaceae bacterium SQ149]
MSNSENHKDHEFKLWLDGKLSPEQSMQFEQDIADDEAMQQRLATARFIEQQVHCYEEQATPTWDRESTFLADSKPWWQWQGLPALSMAFSIFAICLVIFKVELVMQDSGLLVNFGGKSVQQNPVNVDQLINQRLKEFAAEQQVVMANYAADMKDDQQDNNLKLATYLMSASRQERKEDISSFVKFVNEQRDEDAIDQKLRFQKLEYALQSQSIENTLNSPMLKKANYEQPMQEK